ncbi:carbohydrate-binding protein [Salmonirosea aquatica]|uniref:Carbohydrate-binding protein n=1 Tax=Salmonirosea aquatica TaxID=2654236 RepID=A0A7C9BC31_9BACT|nr:carbohydrate-binding protein [Cytophagaceae bacterium SJW1-29]
MPLTTRTSLWLRPAQVEVEQADSLYQIRKERGGISGLKNGSFFVLKNIDLKEIKNLTYRYAVSEPGVQIEVHTGSPGGPLLSTLSYTPSESADAYAEASTPVKTSSGIHDLYFVFVRKEDNASKNSGALDWVRFGR